MNLQVILTVIYAILIFAVIIFVHELGHFLTAKLFKVTVFEFALGMGPALFKKKYGETLYALRLIPIGGYCQMDGENEESDNPGAFVNKKPWQRFIILISGALMNFLLGFISMLVLVSVFSGSVFSSLTVDTVVPDLPAYKAGIQEGDRIISLNGNKTNIAADFRIYNDKPDMDIVVERNGEKLPFKITPESYLVNEKGEIIKKSDEKGSVKLLGISFKKENKTFISIVKSSWYQTLLLGKMVIISLKGLANGQFSPSDLSGPVGIVKEINTAAKMGVENILYLLALITVNLGIFNLLPLPALDGGRGVFVLIEMIIRKPVPRKYEGIIHGIGFLLLLLLMLYATGNDLARIFK